MRGGREIAKERERNSERLCGKEREKKCVHGVLTLYLFYSKLW